MGMSGTVKSKLIAKLEEYESRSPHMYRDTAGVVTVGVGHALASAQAATNITFWTMKDKRPDKKATAKEIGAEYDSVYKQAKGKNWRKYTYKLIVKDGDINSLRDTDIATFYSQLKSTYTVSAGYKQAFDDMPDEVQLALFDMIFNLGSGGLKKFAKLNAAIKVQDWSTAADECSRGGIQPARNSYVRNLFKSLPPAEPPKQKGAQYSVPLQGLP